MPSLCRTSSEFTRVANYCKSLFLSGSLELRARFVLVSVWLLNCVLNYYTNGLFRAPGSVPASCLPSSLSDSLTPRFPDSPVIISQESHKHVKHLVQCHTAGTWRMETPTDFKPPAPSALSQSLLDSVVSVGESVGTRGGKVGSLDTGTLSPKHCELVVG